MRWLLLLVALTSVACSQPEPMDAGTTTDAGPVRDAGVDAGTNRCELPTGAFVGCSTACGVCTGEVTGFPLYSLNNPTCGFDLFCFQPSRRACPTQCPPPAQADRGTAAVFTLGATFDAGPAVSGVLSAPVSTSLLSLRAGARFVVVRPASQLAVCDWATSQGLVLLFVPAADGGLTTGRFAVSSTSMPPEGTVVATFNSNGVALDGSVTLTSLSPPTGTFDLALGSASGSGGVVQGSFEAVPCSP